MPRLYKDHGADDDALSSSSFSRRVFLGKCGRRVNRSWCALTPKESGQKAK